MTAPDLPQGPDPAVPADACDTHVHLFGPADRYPYAPGRSYSPPDALPDDLRALHRRLGIARTVLVQPSPYGTDNTRLLAGLRTLGASARGIAVVAPGADPGELRAMDREGVRGVRVNLSVSTSYDLDRARERVRATARTIAPLGWHLDLNVGSVPLPALRELLAGLPAPVVLDHFAGIRPAAATCAEALRTARSLLATGRVWVKLSAPYRVSDGGDHADLVPVLDTVLAARPDRALWGSDWPHTGGTPADRAPDRVQPYLAVDDALSFRRFLRHAGASHVRRILTANPAELYGF